MEIYIREEENKLKTTVESNRNGHFEGKRKKRGIKPFEQVSLN